jgi:hypothetical protein
MPPPPLWAWVPIAAGAGTDEITLTLAPGASVAGRILSRDNPAQLDIGRIRPALIAIDSPFGEQRFTESGDRELSGHFEIAGLPPGEFRVELSGLPPGWIPVEAIVDDRDVLDRALVVRSGERIDSMVIVLSNRPASVAGTVTGADDAPACLDPVVVFPVDRARRGPASRWIRLAQPDVDGRYEVRDLPPGEYFIAAAPIDWNPALEPDRLLEIEALARRTRLPAGEPVQLDLRVVR